MFLHCVFVINDESRELKELFINKKNTTFKDSFKFLKTINKNKILLRYRLTGRIGYIKILIEKEKNILMVKPYQSIIGFGVPIVSFVLATLFQFLREQTLSFSFFIFSVFWTFLIFYYFKQDCKRIEQLIREYLKNNH